MTGRYTRKPAPLEVRGISRGPLDYPDDSLGPVNHFGDLDDGEFVKNVNRAISNYGEDTVSGRSSPDGWITALNTGNTTERSSVISTVTYDDEFDKEASRTVRRLFEEIDSLLYERSRSPERNYTQQIQKECNDWLLQFPHIRLIGKQLLTPQEQGYEAIPQETPRPSTGSVLIDVEQDSNHDGFGTNLGIVGKGVKAITAPVEPHRTTDPEYAHLYEEVFAQDGSYEEFMAVDYHLSDENHRSRHKQKKGYPPVTPTANIKDSVASSAFDCVWHDSLDWIKRLLSHYTAVLLGELMPAERVSINLVPNLTPSRIDQLLNRDPFPDLRGGLIEKQHTYPQLKTSSGSSFPSVDPPPLKGKQLEDVLKIKSKVLNVRMDKGGLHESLESRASMRIDSGILRVNRPGSVQYPRSGMTSETKKTRVKLAPIGTMSAMADSNRVRTPNWDDERTPIIGELRGRGLQIGDRSASPPYMFNKNGALPPIPVGLEPSESLASMQRPIMSQKKAHFSLSRASSAVHENKDARMILKEKPHAQHNPDWNRPSTTHTFRSDMGTPFLLGNPRRSSTPLDLNGRRGVGQNASGFLGITGNSISNPPHPDQAHVDDDDDVGYIIHPQLAPRESASLNNPYRRAKIASSMAR